MRLQTQVNNKNYSMDVTPFRDDEEQRLYYFICLTDNGYMLVEKKSPKDKWEQIIGGTFTAELQDSIYKELDKAILQNLMSETKHIDHLDRYYFSKFN